MALVPGIYAPVPTFFDADERIDLQLFSKHVQRLAKAGIAPVVAGTMGEAIHLSPAERKFLITAAKRALAGGGPVIAGTGASTTRDTINLCIEAADAGADYALVILPGFFASQLDTSAILAFYKQVADESPIPVMIYNYPAASGIDLDSKVIITLAKICPNICGVKLTCASIGNLVRIAYYVSQPELETEFPRKNPHAPFLVLGGYADFLLPALYANAHGAITGLANIAPYAIAKLFKLTQASKTDSSLLPEALRLQGIIARADDTINRASIAGIKHVLQEFYGYGGLPRRPLPPMPPCAAQALWDHSDTQDLIELEGFSAIEAQSRMSAE